ncbi:YdcF family protein [Nonomuraea aurantiaca]|uniref:YdcF family protein n=1 Tax=Nonomuraea aurantiaca TaxID=2878562 RepID=UPI0027E087C8|nr:ElyC/SanA/YdcF family protein [Nonomuraea aurantiaca]
MSVEQQVITDEQWQHARTIWDYHQMHHDLRRCDVAIGLGSHDLGVARAAAELYRAGWFPLLVFSGATSPTTAARFPRGEAVHFREHALELGVPDEAILLACAYHPDLRSGLARIEDDLDVATEPLWVEATVQPVEGREL